MERASDNVKGKRGGDTLFLNNMSLGNRYLQMFRAIQKEWNTVGRIGKTLERMITEIYDSLKGKTNND